MKRKNVVYCNACAREVTIEGTTNREEVISVRKEWGFNSKKDLQTHEFVLCEQCYDKIIENFCLDITVSEKIEMI